MLHCLTLLCLTPHSFFCHTITATSDSEDSDSDDDDADDGPRLEHRALRHPDGGVNRVRVMPHDEVQIVASWSESGKVHIWDMTEQMRSVDQPQQTHQRAPMSVKPVHSVDRHTTEGFAMDWSRLTAGRLLSGDCANGIYLTERRDTEGWVTEPTPFVGHTSSVEDLQWSPTQANVFASSSVDQTVKVWDTRMRKKCGMSVHVHQSDVNVISWNPTVTHLLASGSDEGAFSVWDLRHWKGYVLTCSVYLARVCHGILTLRSFTAAMRPRRSSGIARPSLQSSGIRPTSLY